MSDELVTNEQAFNEEFLKFLKDNLLHRPGMWVGREDFDLVAAFINGMVSAYGNMGYVPKLQDWDFQRFVISKYGLGNNVVWMAAYTTQAGWANKTEREKMAVLLEDFEQFANPLTRMVMGIDD